jgi:hypothetical protein
VTDPEQSPQRNASDEVGTTSGQSAIPPSASDHNDGNHHDTSGAARRLLLIAGILAIGIAAFGWARELFPKEHPITNPPLSYHIGIQASGVSTAIGSESFVYSQQPDGNIKIVSTIPLAFSSTQSAQYTVQSDLELFDPTIKVIQCPKPTICRSSFSPGLNERATIIEFVTTGFSQTASAVIRDPSFGFSENNEMALVQFPSVNVQSYETSAPNPQGAIPFSLSISYDIPNPHAYFWSLPPTGYTSTGVTWAETFPVGTSKSSGGGTIQANELTGTNYDAQSTDSQHTFVAGLLFGVAGGAAVTAIQELLHLILKIR